ncbi:hypothetical protein BASA60_001868 [Batrachochytrium salamandrivorans]|nr:hypothetical protein BASA60_001868 [Batrachochytrium salamandrivorans]
MKVRTLIVAAMVITSVNAGGDDTPPSGAENSGGSRPKSGAPFGLRVIPLFQLPPRGSSGNGPNTPQESETAKQEPTGGSDVKNIPKDLICKAILDELDRIREKAIGTKCLLWNKMNKARKDWGGIYKLSHPELHGRLTKYHEKGPELGKRLKQELIDLKKRYRKVWIELEIEDCSIESRPYLKSPEDMLERGILS